MAKKKNNRGKKQSVRKEAERKVEDDEPESHSDQSEDDNSFADVDAQGIDENLDDQDNLKDTLKEGLAPLLGTIVSLPSKIKVGLGILTVLVLIAVAFVYITEGNSIVITDNEELIKFIKQMDTKLDRIVSMHNKFQLETEKTLLELSVRANAMGDSVSTILAKNEALAQHRTLLEKMNTYETEQKLLSQYANLARHWFDRRQKQLLDMILDAASYNTDGALRELVNSIAEERQAVTQFLEKVRTDIADDNAERLKKATEEL